MQEALVEGEHHSCGPHKASQYNCVNGENCWYINGVDNYLTFQLQQGLLLQIQVLNQQPFLNMESLLS